MLCGDSKVLSSSGGAGINMVGSTDVSEELGVVSFVNLFCIFDDFNEFLECLNFLMFFL